MQSLSLSARLAALLAACCCAAFAAAPQTGPVDADFAGVDHLMQGYLAARKMPGATLVIAYGERIVYAQGYGWADVARQIPTSPWLEYRLGSVSKPVTAAMIMRLVESGQVQLDAPAWNYIAAFIGTSPADARLQQVTVRQLLTHTWGLDRSVSQDPVGGWYWQGATVISAARDMLRYHLVRMQLDFQPGARFAYNNTGFAWLHLIAELVDGRPLEQQASAAMGADSLSTGVFRFGQVLPSALTPAEPVYYDYAGAPQWPPVPGVYPPPAPALVPRPDGGYTLIGYGGSGGLVASPLTLARFIQRLTGARAPALLQPATRTAMFTEQALADGTRYWGLGVQSWNAYTPSDYVVAHTGAAIGSRNGFRSTPRAPNGAPLMVFVQTNGTPEGQGTEVTDNITAEIVDPVIFAVDQIGYAKVGAKPEIPGTALIAPGSATETWFIDRLLDWGEQQFPQLLSGPASSSMYDGYRYRHYPASGSYVGVKAGRVWLYRPSLSGAITDVGALMDYLPQVQRATSGAAP
ncbi:MAG: beta-lactamase family protein [Burkholderiales bacterium]|nr:beta-lactamase family protein [Burkholderiales bacterium]